MINKAFIFDMDGVIIDSETWWNKMDSHYSETILGQKLAKKILPNSFGQSLKTIYNRAVREGFSLSWKEFFAGYDKMAQVIYRQAPLTKNINHLIDRLLSKHYRLGLVSASCLDWIKLTLKRLDRPKAFKVVISLDDRPDLKSKPAPDGYLKAMKRLGVKPENSFVLEDTETGIRAGKASGAYTIGLTEHLPAWHQPAGGDLFF